MAGVAVAAAVASGGCAAREPTPEPPADLVLVGSAVYTADAARSWARAVAVRDGRIVFVGDDPGARALVGPRTSVVEIADAMVLPGFVDAHVHPISGGTQLLSCDLSDAATVDALLAAVKRCAERRPDAPWVVGGGWALPLFADGNPHRRALDGIVPDRPVALAASDGHSLWVNSKALAIAGVTRDTPDPERGRIERDPATGEPTGTLRESARLLIAARIPPPGEAERAAALRLAAERAHRAGITSWFEASADAAELASYCAADREGGLGVFVRVALYVDPARGVEQVGELSALRERPCSVRVAPGAAKIFADGVIESGTAALLEPYVGRGGSRGELVWSAERLREIALALDAADFQLHIHAIGDRAARAALDAIEAVEREHGRRDRRPVLAHLQLVDPSDTPRFRRLGVAAAFQPLWALEDAYIRELTAPFLGPERSRRLYPIGALARSGAPLAAGSDWPVSAMDPLEAIEVALTRRDPVAAPGPAWLPEERTDLATALGAYTIGGAWALFREREVGTIEVGKRADLVVLARNLFELPPHEISETRVLATYFEGREVYRAE